MPDRINIAIISDIHYAGPMERAQGDEYEFDRIRNPLLRIPYRCWRNLVWAKHPTRLSPQLDKFISTAEDFDHVICNGDLACDCASLGLMDAAAHESARECLDKLRNRFGNRLRFVIGDHELGKLSVMGDRGGLRLHSWDVTTKKMGIPPFWRLDVGRYVLLGVTSTLAALPAYSRDILPAEKAEWEHLRTEHMAEISEVFDTLQPGHRVILLCHDPTALPYLARLDAIAAKLHLIEQTIIGHLHSNLILWKSRVLTGLPVIRSLGGNVQRMSTALNEARDWEKFKVRLCPALAGIELLNDGGFLKATLDSSAQTPVKFHFHPLPR